jgi:hypothetical protein
MWILLSVNFMFICNFLVHDLMLPCYDNLLAKVRRRLLHQSQMTDTYIKYAYILLSPHELCYKTRFFPTYSEPRSIYSLLTNSVQPDDGQLKAETCSCFIYLMFLYDLLC